jgi:hypothetical protein
MKRAKAPVVTYGDARATRDEMKLSALLIVVSGLGFALGGCGGTPAPAQDPSQTPAPNAESTPGSADGSARPALTAQECEASGGSVVGDIGDGAIHRPEYRCANGAKPSGSIRAAEGGPMAIEGSVCCPH